MDLCVLSRTTSIFHHALPNYMLILSHSQIKNTAILSCVLVHFSKAVVSKLRTAAQQKTPPHASTEFTVSQGSLLSSSPNHSKFVLPQHRNLGIKPAGAQNVEAAGLHELWGISEMKIEGSSMDQWAPLMQRKSFHRHWIWPATWGFPPNALRLLLLSNQIFLALKPQYFVVGKI